MCIPATCFAGIFACFCIPKTSVIVTVGTGFGAWRYNELRKDTLKCQPLQSSVKRELKAKWTREAHEEDPPDELYYRMYIQLFNAKTSLYLTIDSPEKRNRVGVDGELPCVQEQFQLLDPKRRHPPAPIKHGDKVYIKSSQTKQLLGYCGDNCIHAIGVNPQRDSTAWVIDKVDGDWRTRVICEGDKVRFKLTCNSQYLCVNDSTLWAACQSDDPCNQSQLFTIQKHGFSLSSLPPVVWKGKCSTFDGGEFDEDF
ncbi:unnamed protein product [Prorocentrum cordatum]|uniref:Ricin B lectin domain-containing protein n=1 Tax=Prorocentrum cordatum TaxID=2364126 RepID=A0ABN9XZC0_9DINO|nr:unnamed protein product [Polarella glacialis]